MFFWKKVKFYKYFKLGKDNTSKDDILIKNEIVKENDVLIAWRNNGYFSFAKFFNVDHFINFYNNCTDKQKSFYAVFINDERYLYVDIDYKLIFPIDDNKKKRLIYYLLHLLDTFTQINIKCNTKNWLIWDATRNDKFSIHIINTDIILKCKVMHKFINVFKSHAQEQIEKKFTFITHKDKKFIVDTNVYAVNYQLWRLPLNHNGNLSSFLKLYNIKDEKIFDFKTQLKINLMNVIPKNLCIDIKFTKQQKLTHNNQNNQKLCLSNLKLCKYVKINQLNNVMTNIFNNNYEIINMNSNDNSYRIRKHYCPIAGREHKNNTGKIQLIHLQYMDKGLSYIKYLCMDEDCVCKYQYHRIINNDIIRPWIFRDVPFINKNVLNEIDYMIDIMFKNNIITYKEQMLQFQIIKDNKICTTKKDIIFSTFFHDNIIHTKCGISNMSIYYRSKEHIRFYYGQATAFCHICQIYYNLNNFQLTYSS